MATSGRLVVLTVAQNLLLLLLGTPQLGLCLALPSIGRGLEHYVEGQDGYYSHRKHVGLLRLLHFVIYALMALSTVLLVASAGAIVQMPNPHCMCYSVSYSDSAVCFGAPCCACVNIRQANLTMVLFWNFVLLCELALGIELLFVYPFLGFCILHGIAVIGAYLAMRTFRRRNPAAVQAAGGTRNLSGRPEDAGPRRSGRAGGGGDGSRSGDGSGAAANGSAVPPSIQTMSAELVLVLQPEFDFRLESGDGCTPARRSRDPLQPDRWQARHGSGGGAGGGLGEGWGAGGGAGGAAAASVAFQPFKSGVGIAWALRYTRLDPPTASPGTAPDTAKRPAPSSPPSPLRVEGALLYGASARSDTDLDPDPAVPSARVAAEGAGERQEADGPAPGRSPGRDGDTRGPAPAAEGRSAVPVVRRDAPAGLPADD